MKNMLRRIAAVNPFKLKYYKIEHKLLLTYPALILASILIVSAFAVYFSNQLLKERSITYAESLLKQISYNIDSKLTRIDKDSYVFYHNSDVKAFFKSALNADGQEYYRLRSRLEEFLTNFLLTHPDIESVYLINPQGNVMSTVDSLNLNKLDEYREAADKGQGKIVWMNAKVSSIGNRIVPFVRNINDLSTLKTNGVLLMHYRLSAINTEHDLSIGGKLVVMDPMGSVLTSDNEDEFGQPADREVRSRLTVPEGDFFLKEPKETAFYVYYKSDFTNWTYLYRIPEEQLYRGINQVRNLVIAVACLFGVLSIIVARVIAYNISRPIHGIVKEMRNIERNDLLVNLKYDGADELHVLAVSFNHMMNRLRKLMRRESDLQRMQHELEMRALQAEINPHFLYNTLDAINWMGRMNHVPEISQMTSMLADIMRYSIGYRRELVRLEDEFVHMQKYIGIQQIRYKDKLSVFFDMPEELMDVSIPKLTLQPIVENAIIHGLESKVGTGRIRVVGHKEGQQVVVTIEDDGCGIPGDKIQSILETERTEPSARVGIHNVNKRLKLFFGDSYGLKVESVLGKGTRVIITLPFSKEG